MRIIEDGPRFESRRQEPMQRAARAGGNCFAAEMFAGEDDESVELVEELMVGWKRRFKKFADLVVGEFWVSEAVAFEDAAGGGVGGGRRVVCGVEEDGSSGFPARCAGGAKIRCETRRWRGAADFVT